MASPLRCTTRTTSRTLSLLLGGALLAGSVTGSFGAASQASATERSAFGIAADAVVSENAAPVIRDSIRAQIDGEDLFLVSVDAPKDAAVTARVQGSDGNNGSGGLSRAFEGVADFLWDVSYAGQQIDYFYTAQDEDGDDVEYRTTAVLDDRGAQSVPGIVEIKLEDDQIVLRGVGDPDATIFATSGAPGAIWGTTASLNGAWELTAPTFHGSRLDLFTVTDGTERVDTFFGLPTDGNTAAEQFPLELASPAAGETVSSPVVTFTGDGIPGSTVAITTGGGSGFGIQGLACETVIGADGSWSCDAPELPNGDHTATITETTIWSGVAPQTHEVSFTVDASEQGALKLRQSVKAGLPGEDAFFLVDLEVPEDVVVAAQVRDAQFGGEGAASSYNGIAGFVWDERFEGETVDYSYTTQGHDGETIEHTASYVLEHLADQDVDGVAELIIEDGEVILRGVAPAGVDVWLSLGKPGPGRIFDPRVDRNGAWEIAAPAFFGSRIDLHYSVDNKDVRVQTFFGIPTDGNNAAEQFPLELASPAAGDVVETPTVTFTGEGIPGSSILITDADGSPFSIQGVTCETVVAADGTWSCDSPALANGSHTAMITETTIWDGVAPQTHSVAFTIAADGETAPEFTVADGVATGGTISPRAKAFTGTGTPGALVEITNPWGIMIASATIDDDGSWTALWNWALSEGHYTGGLFTMIDGDTTQGIAYDFIIEAPAQSTEFTVNDGVAMGGTISSRAGAFSGTGVVGASIEITNPWGAVIAATTIDAEGTWTAPWNWALGEGHYTGGLFTMVDGENTHEIAYDFIVEVPAASTAFSVNDGATTGETLPSDLGSFSGTGIRGASIEITNPWGIVIGSATIDEDGTWIAPWNWDLAEGHYTGGTFTMIDGDDVHEIAYDFIVEAV